MSSTFYLDLAKEIPRMMEGNSGVANLMFEGGGVLAKGGRGVGGNPKNIKILLGPDPF